MDKWKQLKNTLIEMQKIYKESIKLMENTNNMHMFIYADVSKLNIIDMLLVEMEILEEDSNKDH